MKNMFKNKTGDITAKQLISIIILIVSFSVILLFFFMLDLGGEIDAEACRNSVQMKTLIPVLGGQLSFRCKTQEVLITETEPQKIYKEFAELERDCFWMMGEGQINLGGNRVCAICSVIEFNEDIRNVNLKDYLIYLVNTNISGRDLSYYQYLNNQPNPESFIDFEFESNQKYVTIYVYDSQTKFEDVKNYFSRTLSKEHSLSGIIAFNSEIIKSLNCDEFATTA